MSVWHPRFFDASLARLLARPLVLDLLVSLSFSPGSSSSLSFTHDGGQDNNVKYPKVTLGYGKIKTQVPRPRQTIASGASPSGHSYLLLQPEAQDQPPPQTCRRSDSVSSWPIDWPSSSRTMSFAFFVTAMLLGSSVAIAFVLQPSREEPSTSAVSRHRSESDFVLDDLLLLLAATCLCKRRTPASAFLKTCPNDCKTWHRGYAQHQCTHHEMYLFLGLFNMIYGDILDSGKDSVLDSFQRCSTLFCLRFSSVINFYSTQHFSLLAKRL